MESNIDATADANAPQQPPPPILPPPVERDKNGEGDDDNPDRHHIQETHVKPKHWTKYVEAVCAIALVLITAYYTRAAYRQAKASETAANAARDAVCVASRTLSETQKNNATQARLTDAARISSQQAAQRAIQATQASIRQDQRAWVGIGNITANPTTFHVGDQAFINVSFKNTGKTPARNMLLTAVKDPVAKGAPPNFSYQGEKIARYGLLSPNGDNFVSLSVATKEPRPLTEAVLDELASGNTILYIHGQLTYQDIFSRYHWTTFCYFLQHPRDTVSFGACSEHNDAGDGKTPKYQPPKIPSQWPPAN